MIVGKLSDTTRGWVIGDFEPSLLKTKDFEVGILTHLKDETFLLGTKTGYIIIGYKTPAKE